MGGDNLSVRVPGGTPGPRPPVALPLEGKSNIREGGENLVWGPAWLKIKTVKFLNQV
jgi:hypothetical protein